MPVIKVWCLPVSSEDTLQHLRQCIIGAACSVKVLALKGEEDVTVLFPPDSMSYGLGLDIIVEITGLFEREERTREVIQTLAFRVGKVFKQLFPKTKNVECFVYPFNPHIGGFWSSRDKTSVLDIPITELDFRGTQKERLIAEGIKTLGDLIQMPRENVAKLRTFGKKSMYALDEALEHFGLEFLK